MRTALVVAGFAMAALASGCGGEDGAPTDASVEEFCGNFESFAADSAALGADAEQADMVDVIRDFADQMVETGTPEDIPDDAREGFELTTSAIQDLDDDATADDLASLDEDFSDADQEKADAFDDYLEETCQE